MRVNGHPLPTQHRLSRNQHKTTYYAYIPRLYRSSISKKRLKSLEISRFSGADDGNRTLA